MSKRKSQPDWLTGRKSARTPRVRRGGTAADTSTQDGGRDGMPGTQVLDPPAGSAGQHAAGQAGGSAAEGRDQRANFFGMDSNQADRPIGRRQGRLASMLERLGSGGSVSGDPVSGPSPKKPGAQLRHAVALALAAAALILLVVGFVWWAAPFSGDSEAAGGERLVGVGGGSDSSEEIAPEQSPVESTGIVFEAIEVEGEEARLSTSDGLVWEGSLTAGEEGETITLSGPTAAQIKRGFKLPRSEIQSGTYAIAQPDGRVLHVTFNTFSAGDAEVTQGSILSVEQDRLAYSGFYRDERDSGSEEVVRTYMPPGEENYRVSFKAPEGTPVPLLAGFRGTRESSEG